jgi:hypothetical protein
LPPKYIFSAGVDKTRALWYIILERMDEEMTKQEMIYKVNKAITSQSGYSYNPAIVTAIIEAGTIPEGHILSSRCDQVAKYENGNVNVYTKDILTKSLKAEGATLEAALMTYATGASRLGISMGRM